MSYFVTIFIFVGLAIILYTGGQSYQHTERIDCYPDRELSFSNYSKKAFLARHCLFDDQALPNEIQCYTVKINLDNKELHSTIRHRIQMNEIQRLALTE
jgi:hypothetical protein